MPMPEIRRERVKSEKDAKRPEDEFSALMKVTHVSGFHRMSFTFFLSSFSLPFRFIRSYQRSLVDTCSFFRRKKKLRLAFRCTNFSAHFSRPPKMLYCLLTSAFVHLDFCSVAAASIELCRAPDTSSLTQNSMLIIIAFLMMSVNTE